MTFVPPEWKCLRGGIASLAANGSARRFASAPIIRCCAAVGGSAALRMRHTPCGCRSAHLIEVQPNFRLPPVSSMRRAPAMPHSARSLPPFYRHSRLTLVRRGCKTVTNRRGSWRSHVHRTHTAQRMQFFKIETANANAFLLDGRRPFSFHGKKMGSRSCSAYGAASPRHKCRDPLRTCAKKGAFYGLYNESHCQNPL